MTSNKPVGEIRYGRIKATIWSNDTEHGIRYSVSVRRIYKSGEEWKTSESFWRDDIPLVIKALDEAHSLIFRGLGSGTETDESED